MKKHYEKMSVSILQLSLENPVLAGSPEIEIADGDTGVTVKDLEDGFKDDGGFMDITFE